jgi:hypothetical protein
MDPFIYFFHSEIVLGLSRFSKDTNIDAGIGGVDNIPNC